MEKLTGTIANEPSEDGGQVRFSLLRDDTKKLEGCVSAVDFEGAMPKAGASATLTGERKADLILGRTPYFVFSRIEQ